MTVNVEPRPDGAAAAPVAPDGTSDRQRARARRLWLTVAVLTLVSLGAAALVAFLPGSAPAQSGDKDAPAVKTERAQRTDMTLKATHRGELDADVAELAAQTTGYLVEVSVSIGDQVKKGDVLAQVEATQAESDIASAHAEELGADAALKRNAAQLAQAETELERGKQAFEKSLISQKEMVALQSAVDVLRAEGEAARAQQAQAKARLSSTGVKLRDTKLTAPFDGAVAERYVDTGSMVRPGTAVLRLVRTGPLRVRFRVAERSLGRITPDLLLEISTQATADKHFKGKVTRIAAEVSRVDRTVAVEGVLTDETTLLRPGMYAEVKLELGTLKQVVVVPSGAVIDRIKQDGSSEAGVFVMHDDKVKWTPIKVLGVDGDRTAVDTIAADAEVVTLGHNHLRDGVRVRRAEAPAP